MRGGPGIGRLRAFHRESALKLHAREGHGPPPGSLAARGDRLELLDMRARYLNLIVGAWLVLGPALFLGLERRARLSDAIVGVALAVVAIAAPRLRFARRITALLAIWLVVAPFALRYRQSAAVLHDVLLGCAVFALSLIPRVPAPDGEQPFAPPRGPGA